MIDLIKKLEEAMEGSRELDVEVSKFIGRIDGWPAPYYTTSIDCALTLVPKGYWELGGPHPQNGFSAYLAEVHPLMVKKNTTLILDGADAPTPALALCILALKARQHD